MPYCKSEDELSLINAKSLAEAARLGDRTALEVYRISGEALGRSLAIIVDLLNPERIIIGSIFTRAEDLLRHHMERTLSEEALSLSLSNCKILPSGLGEQIGDYAALSVAFLGDK
jgi:glucokinase